MHVPEVPDVGFVRDGPAFKSKAPAPSGVEELRSGLNLGGMEEISLGTGD